MDDTILLPSSKNRQLSKEQTFREAVDIISSLSGNVLLHIFSFLSTKDSIRTSILSRRWQYLWTSIADIYLVDISYWDGKGSYTDRKKYQCPMRQRFSDLVDRVLLIHDFSDIKRLHIQTLEPVDSSRLNSWIFAAVRHNVQDLDLSLSVKTRILLPCCLFTCESLLVLKLFMDFTLKAPSCINFSSLQTLVFDALTFSDDESTQHLLSSCPVLQELTLTNCDWKNIKTLTISIPMLKKLTIEADQFWDDIHSCVVKIYSPNLIYLSFTSNLEAQFYLCDLSSLVNAYIDLPNGIMPEEEISPRLIGVFTAICKVKHLSISYATLQFMTHVENLMDHLPTFHNMTHLELDGEFCCDLTACMIDLLEKIPKLEFLDFAEVFVEKCNYMGAFEDVEKKEEIDNWLRTFPRALESCVIELL